MNGLHTSIIGRAVEKGLLSIEAVNIRDFAGNKHNRVDDYPYGGGAGMVMQAKPVYDAYCYLVEKIGYRKSDLLNTTGTYFYTENGRRICKRERFDIFMRSLRGDR